jgi:hypothetical protein
MALDKLYSVIKQKGLEDGRAYIITGAKQLIEAQIYSAIIVQVKSRTLSHEQIMGSLLTGDITQVDESPAHVRLEDANPETIRHTFHAFSQFILSPDDATPQRLLKILRLLARLGKSGSEGLAALDIIVADMKNAYPKFSLESSVIKKRIDEFSNEFLIAYPFLNGDPIPLEKRQVPMWIFEKISMPESLFKDIFLYFIFFGDYFLPIYKAIVKKESGFGAKVGTARLSKVIYSAALNCEAAAIFKGIAQMGELKINWHSEKKTGVLITQVDLDKLGMRDGDTVNLIFKKN